MKSSVFLPALFLLGLSLSAGALRPFFPKGIAWNGKWPTSSTSAEEAYRMMAREGDPPFVSLQEIIELQDDPNNHLLDARSHDEFVAGRIPRARNLPYYEMEKYQEAALSGVAKTDSIIIYCEGVGCELSFFLGRELVASGYTNVRIFYGGYPEWKDAGLPIEK